MKQNRKHSLLCSTRHQSTTLWTHTRKCTNVHTRSTHTCKHVHRAHVCVLSAGLQCDIYFSVRLTVKKYESHWLINSRPRPVVTTEKQRSPSEEKTHTRRPLSQSPGRRRVPVLAVPSGSLACASNHGRPGAAAPWRRVLRGMSNPHVMTVRQRRILGHCVCGEKRKTLSLSRNGLLIV